MPTGHVSPQDGPRPPPRPQDPFKTANKGPEIANIGPKSGPRPATQAPGATQDRNRGSESGLRPPRRLQTALPLEK